MDIKQREYSFDILKAFCAFLIVCIHTPFPGVPGAYFTALTRIAVPVFFMITGYFYSDTVKRGNRKKQLKKILLLFTKAHVLYLIWKCIYTITTGADFKLFITSTFSLKNIVKFLCFNYSPLASHLWYLGALLYVLLIVWFADKMHIRKFLLYVTPILLLADLMGGKYSLLIFKKEFPLIYVRNFLFVGIPYFNIGNILYNTKTKILLIKKQKIIGYILFFSVTTLVERIILIKYNVNAVRDHYISTTFLATAIFCYSILSTQKTNQLQNILSIIGNKYSAWIYIIHPIIIKLLLSIMEIIHLYFIYQFIAPFAVYFMSILIIAICIKLNENQK